jgi:hypothetical protein
VHELIREVIGSPFEVLGFVVVVAFSISLICAIVKEIKSTIRNGGKK